MIIYSKDFEDNQSRLKKGRKITLQELGLILKK